MRPSFGPVAVLLKLLSRRTDHGVTVPGARPSAVLQEQPWPSWRNSQTVTAVEHSIPYWPVATLRPDQSAGGFHSVE